MKKNALKIRFLLGSGLTLCVLSTLVLSAGALRTEAQSPNAGFHVTICHRTGSASNPYVIISPNVEGVVNGHLDHEQTGNGLGGDIIPQFTYEGVTYSKNLDAAFAQGVTGEQLLARGCNLPEGPPTPTPTPPGMTPPPATPPVPVPEPISLLLFGSGLASIGVAARRRFGKKKVDENEIEKE